MIESFEVNGDIDYYALGDFIKAYVDLKNTKYTFESLDMDCIELISQEEYDRSARVAEKGQYQLF